MTNTVPTAIRLRALALSTCINILAKHHGAKPKDIMLFGSKRPEVIRTRQVLWHHLWIHGMTPDDISRTWGISDTTVRKRTSEGTAYYHALDPAVRASLPISNIRTIA